MFHWIVLQLLTLDFVWAYVLCMHKPNKLLKSCGFEMMSHERALGASVV